MAAFFYRKQNIDIPADEKETARYLGYTGGVLPDATVSAMIHSASIDMQKLLAPQAVYEIFNINIDEKIINFGGTSVESVKLAENLAGCGKVALLAATIGPKPDALIRKTQISDKAQSAVLQSTGAMFIESFVDMLNRKISEENKQEGHRTHPRFSPGYGDVPLEVQHIFFTLLPCSKIGLTLMDSLIMAPEKSVTAFIGIEK